MLSIDCSLGEGGGQCMRTSLGISSLLKKPITLINIRSKQPKPGLRQQHLTAFQTLSRICNAQHSKFEIGTTSIEFSPKEIKPLSLNVNIGTAGSITLLLQTLFIPTLLKEIKLRITGGTDVPFSPSFNYMRKIFFHIIKQTGAKFSSKLIKHGFYPKGNGIVSFKSTPSKFPLSPVKLTKLGSLHHLEIYSHCSSLPKEVAVNQTISAEKTLKQLNVDIIKNIDSTINPETTGSAIDIFAHFSSGAILGANALGRKGFPAEKVGKEAAKKLLGELAAEATVDSHLADQLIPFMALAKGNSEICITKLTQHCLTNISVCEQLLPIKFEVKGKINEKAIINVEGAAFVP